MKGKELLPIPRGSRTLVVWAEARVNTEVVEVIRQTWTLVEALRAEGLTVEEIAVGLEPTGAECATAVGSRSR